ncbi:MAG TPA: monovalent cation/H(+) antiporter subunit G [Casimicrobiaceae bacterium]|jgi:multicomponent K+:H+ antiporter subunit G|nr:monovalent cation/H(+) antiporter subunit G [Casimicrobiaceae bacterium]
MNPAPSAAIEVVVGVLLVLSGALALAAAIGLVSLRSFFQRMHPPALASTLATWCAALATVVYFSALGSRLAVYPWLVVVLVAMTAPITTTLLARAALLRKRAIDADAPPPLLMDK